MNNYKWHHLLRKKIQNVNNKAWQNLLRHIYIIKVKNSVWYCFKSAILSSKNPRLVGLISNQERNHYTLGYWAPNILHHQAFSVPQTYFQPISNWRHCTPLTSTEMRLKPFRIRVFWQSLSVIRNQRWNSEKDRTLSSRSIVRSRSWRHSWVEFCREVNWANY